MIGKKVFKRVDIDGCDNGEEMRVLGDGVADDRVVEFRGWY